MDFKRINYFKGLFLHAEDLQAAERYRDQKHQLHNVHLHGPGIVHGYLDDLNVSVDEHGRRLNVHRGFAIDRRGRELCLSAPVEVSVAEYGPSAVVYIVLRYTEKRTDRRENRANPEYSDYAFIEEHAEVEARLEEPGEDVIELARIRLGAKGARIKMPADPMEPGENEVDLRYRLRAGVARSRFQLQDYATLVREATPHVEGGDRAQIRIEEVPAAVSDPHRFYLVSAHPLGEARITWRLESSVDRRGATEYTLVLENLSNLAVDIRCRVYRID
jgi:hypothetical protein